MTDFTATTIILISGIIVIGFIFSTLFIGILNMRDISKMSDHSIKLNKLEHLVQQIHTNIQINQLETTYNQMMAQLESSRDAGQGQVIFKSADGKHTASSLKELFEKIASDPSSDISMKDMEVLKRFFEQISENVEPLDDEDEDDS